MPNLRRRSVMVCRRPAYPVPLDPRPVTLGLLVGCSWACRELVNARQGPETAATIRRMAATLRHLTREAWGEQVNA